MNKTNAMRILDQKKIGYEVREYELDESDLSVKHVLEVTGLDGKMVYKTLVAKGERSGYVVFCIPVLAELDLKKCARAINDKRVELIPMKDLEGLTGYIRGGCSPVGMKKQFRTWFQQECEQLDTISVSGGRRGLQILVDPKQLIKLINGRTADLIQEDN